MQRTGDRPGTHLGRGGADSGPDGEAPDGERSASLIEKKA